MGHYNHKYVSTSLFECKQTERFHAVRGKGNYGVNSLVLR